MKLLTITIIALGLAMDAFAVSVASGSTCKDMKIRNVLRIALLFGAFQALMPTIGYLAGLTVRQYIAAYDHWVAFALLGTIGAKMIYESCKIDPASKNRDPSSLPVLLVLAVATSIDALAVGVTLSLLGSSIVLTAVVIGLVTFIMSYIGVHIGKTVGHFFEGKIEAVGGVVLIAIGIKIVLEHLLC